MRNLSLVAIAATIGIIGASPAFIKSRYFAFMVGGPSAYAMVVKNAERADFCDRVIPDEKFTADGYDACLRGK